MKIKVSPSNLKGKVYIPPSKSLSHRSIINASLADGKSVIDNIILSEDIESTIDVMRSFGVKIAIEAERKNRYRLIINGSENLTVPTNKLNCNESGSTLRFLIPFFTLVDGPVTYTGRNKLIERPLDSYYKIFDKREVQYETTDGLLPVTIDGTLEAGTYHIAGNISSQFITGLMLVLPLLDGDSKIVIDNTLESVGYVDLTMDLLQKFGIEIINNNYESFEIPGNQQYTPHNYKVEADYSQSAFWIVAKILGQAIDILDLEKDSKQGDKAILDIIEKMGAQVTFKEGLQINHPEELSPVIIDVKDCPDLVPILAVLLSHIDGKSEIINAERLRIKESDRLKAISTELNKLGADIKETSDGLIINGVSELTGGVVDSWNDHRIAMALAIAAVTAKGPVTIERAEAINKSYPSFFEELIDVGGEVSGDEFWK